MSTIAQKLSYLQETKAQLRMAIIGKGVAVPEDTAFRKYPRLISKIVTGSPIHGPFLLSVRAEILE